MSGDADPVRAALYALLPPELGWRQPPTPKNGQGPAYGAVWYFETDDVSVSVGLASNRTLVLTVQPFGYRDEHERPVAYKHPVAVNAVVADGCRTPTADDVDLLGAALAAAGLPVRKPAP